VAGWLRRAGHGRAPDGSIITWSVAEGSRGRRWREVVRAGEGSGIRSSLLLELDRDGRFSHLELSTAAGLLTLHPEGDGTLHGNAVTADGVRHVVGLPWDAETVVLLEGSTVCAAAAGSGPAGRGSLHIGLDLSLRPTSVPPPAPVVDGDGLPPLEGGATWPLEREE
jgi:hypothetical protein